jgi:hypothetical protein
MFMSFEKKQYKVVRKVLSSDMVKYIQIISEIHKKCNEYHVPPSPTKLYPFGDPQTLNSFSWYGPMYGEALLSFLEPTMSKVTRKKLLTSYSYTRTYFNGAVLEKHTDRESIEYSASLWIKKEVNWPCWIQQNSKQIPIELECGDMLIYKGNILPHWREEFTGHEHTQLFLHFVDSNGPYAQSGYLDGRPLLGLPHPKQPLYF